MALLAPAPPPAVAQPGQLLQPSKKKSPSFQETRDNLFQKVLAGTPQTVIPGAGFGVDDQSRVSNKLNDAVDNVEGNRARQTVTDTQKPTGLLGNVGPSATSDFFDKKLTQDFGETLGKIQHQQDLEIPLKQSQRVAKAAENVIRSENLKFSDWATRQKLWAQKKQFEADDKAATAAVVGAAVGVVGAVAGGIAGGPAGAAAGFAAGNAVGTGVAGA